MAISSDISDSSQIRPATLRVLDFEVALGEVLLHAAQLRANSDGTLEEVPLLESAGRVLGRAIAADRDHPPFDRSTRDGFAVRATEFSAGGGWLRIVGGLERASAVER